MDDDHGAAAGTACAFVGVVGVVKVVAVAAALAVMVMMVVTASLVMVMMVTASAADRRAMAPCFLVVTARLEELMSRVTVLGEGSSFSCAIGAQGKGSLWVERSTEMVMMTMVVLG